MIEIDDNLVKKSPNINFENVCFSWPGKKNNVINKCSFSIDKAGFWMIVGHNGSGKSTLLKLINGVLRPSSGVINQIANLNLLYT